jgi:hypothetical protein
MLSSSQRRPSQKFSTKKSAGSQQRSKEVKRNTFHVHHAHSNADSTAQKTSSLIINGNSPGTYKGGQVFSGNNNSMLGSNMKPGKNGVLTGSQKRVQSTAPRLFSYKPSINELGKSPFLQPIVSQKTMAMGVVQSSHIVSNNGMQVLIPPNPLLKQQ